MSEKVLLHELTPPEKSQLSPEQVLGAGTEFLDHFEVEVSPYEQPDAFVEAMDQLNPRFQGERELVRFELEQDQTEWPKETREVIMRAAGGMRMFTPQTPLEGGFDKIIVLGGARQSNLDRMRYAARCLYTRASLQINMPDRRVRQGNLTIAGSQRKLNEAEKENVSNYAKGAETEADLITATVDRVQEEDFRLMNEFGGYPRIMRWGSMIAKGEKVGTPQIIDMVLSEMKDWADQTGRPIPKDFKLGAVTTQIYQVSTELDLARVAKKYGINETFTAGNPSDPNIVAKRTPATYLSEVLRTLKAAAPAKAENVSVGLKEYPVRPFGLGDYYI